VASSIKDKVKLINDSKIKNSNNKSSTAWKILKNSTGMTKYKQEISSLNIDGKEEIIKLNIANALNHTFL
jgi:hypothetical protein